jgi:hypothetical protein
LNKKAREICVDTLSTPEPILQTGNAMKNNHLEKNILCYQSMMALLFSLSEEEEMDESFIREAEEIIAEMSGLSEKSIFRYELDK